MRSPRGWPGRAGLPALAALLFALAAWACGDSPAAPGDAGSEARIAELVLVGGSDQRLVAGRRSPEPFRVLARDGAGEPVPGAVLEFTSEGPGGGVPSQPRALTDSAGVAESYLVETESGEGTLVVRGGSEQLGVPLVVEPAPGELIFEEASGAVGLPGKPHPDSVVRVRVRDRRGRPMAGQEVWFAGPPELARYVDTTDTEGWASTVVRETALAAGDGRVFAFILGFPDVITWTPRPVENPAERVVLVSVDGLRADAIDRYRPPTLSALAAEGAFTDRAETVEPSLTVPAHLSLLSGVAPETHGLWSEQLTFTAEMALLEPLFKQAAGNGMEARAFMAGGGPLAAFEEILACRLAFGLDSLTLAEPRAPAVVADAGAALADPAVEMLWLHLPDPDLAGHAHGFESPEYEQAVMAVDAALADLVAGLDERTLLVVTSDHGGGGRFGDHQHGSTDPEDVRIPLVLHGPRTVPGPWSPPEGAGPVSILDVAPTVLWALGHAPPGQYEGRVLLEAFR